MNLIRGVEFSIGYLRLAPHEADRLRAAAKVAEADRAEAERETRLQRMREEECQYPDAPCTCGGAHTM